MAYFMGIDQGGTKTDVIIADHEGRVAGTGNDRDMEYAAGEWRAVLMSRIKYAAEKAAASAGIALSAVQSVSASCTGADWAFEYEIGRKNLRRTLGIEQVSLYNDCIGALRGGTEIKGRDCAVICLGSGANCAVLSREGEEYIFGYYVKSVHQGAGAIGRFIFEAVFDAECGLGKKTLLTDLLLEKTGYLSAEELFMALTTGRAEKEKPLEVRYKDYSPLLFEAVKRGDETAAEYLEWFCRELARYIITAAARLNMRDRAITLVLSGGVAKNDSARDFTRDFTMLDLIETRLKEELPGINCVNAHFEPVAGSLLLEYDRVYPGGIPEEVLKRFEESCSRQNLLRTAEHTKFC